jgi:ketosteroid isomerase-like protein
MSDNERQIREVIEAKAATMKTGDAKTMLSYYTPEVVEFSLAPPLRQPADKQDPAPLEGWLATFEAPPVHEVTRLEIAVGGDVAFATSIDSMTAIPKGMTEPFTLWYRVTLGLRRVDGRWLVTHEHNSVPFEMDGSMRASVDLEP